MDWVKTINAAITYMEEHLTEEIRLNDIDKEWLPGTEYEFVTDGYLDRILPGDSTAPDYVGELCIPIRMRG